MIKFFKKVLEIRSKEGHIHFRRWRLIEFFGRGIYLHHFTRADQDKHLHDHPWNFYSLVLKGGYIEKTISGDVIRKPGNFGYIPGEKFHQIKSLPTGSSWTLIFRGKRFREWGYLVDGKWMEHQKYRTLKRSGRL